MGGESDRWGFNGAGCVWLGGSGGVGGAGAEDGGLPQLAAITLLVSRLRFWLYFF